MRILLASSEAHPYSKTGGLADMVGALGKALAHLGHEVGLATPLYADVRERFNLQPAKFPLDVPLGIRRVQGEIWTLQPVPGFTIYFIDQPEFYQRAGLYQKDGQDYPDNAERFIFFSKAVSELALHLPFQPELLHAHDWQAALSILLLHHTRRLAAWTAAPRSCFTIHNLAYQGVFPASQYPLTNLPWDFFTHAGVEFYGRLNCLKAGIAFANAITTVSPRYAREITTEEFGAGLDGLLRQRQDLLFGILNGVDYGEWDPATDPAIPAHFGPEDVSGKRQNKGWLQAEFGLQPRPDVPLFGNIGRMVEQKGVDILLGALEIAATQDFQFVLLGSGAPETQRAFQRLADRYPGKVSVRIGFNEVLSHRVEAGCDFFIMPSRFEPCGLNQMYSLKYGTIPIVRAVGGLDDSIIDPRENAARATGIKFHEYAPEALAKAMLKAMAVYGDGELLRHFRRNGMSADFSWERTAQEYVKIYERALDAGRQRA
jgi:starch synthase